LFLFVFGEIFGLWLRYLPIPPVSQFYKYQKELKSLIQQMIDKKLMVNDLLSKMKEEEFKNDDIIDNSITFILGSHDTAASLLSFTLIYLIKYPQVRKKLLLEIENYITNIDDVQNNINDLKYMDQVV
jgi:cytochrome P450